MSIISIEAGSESAEVLEPVEAAFDSVALFVEIFAVLVRVFGVGFWRNDHLHAPPLQVPSECFAGIAFIGEQRFGFEAAYQRFRFLDIGSFSAGKLRAHRQAFFVGGQMDFGAQPSAGSPHSLIAEPPFPALDC